VFALGGSKGELDAANSGYFAVRGLLAKSVAEAARFIVDRGLLAEGGPVLVRLIAQIASRFGVVVTQKLAAQAVPMIGALGGAAVNYAFIDHFQEIARAHFTVRRSNGATAKTPSAWPMTGFQPPHQQPPEVGLQSRRWRVRDSISAGFGLSQRRPCLSRHTFRKSQRTRRNRFRGQSNGPKVAASPGGDRDDLVDTPSLRGGRLVRHGGFLRRQRLGRSFRAGLYDGKSEHRREHHAVCRARRSDQQLRPGRATLWPGRPHGAVWRSTRPVDAFQSFHRLRLQRHAS
jgi:hypothetical protein